MKSKNERIRLQNALLQIHAEVKAELMEIPGVYDVSIGLKERAGKLTDEIVFQVYVPEKKAESELPPEQIIPKEIRGYKTDVLRIPKGGKRVDSSEHRPIKGGIQIGNGKGHVGTLGWFGRMDDDTLVLLTNEHVLYSNGATSSDKIGQPDIEHNCCCCCAHISGEIGVILNPGIDNDNVDCALATVKDEFAVDLIVNNAMKATEIRITGTKAATLGDIVRKVGRTSGFTTGTVSSINGPAPGKNGQIHIRPVDAETYTEQTNGKKAFSDGGDSGAVIVNEEDEIIGLLWGGDPDTEPVDITFACHIQDVLDALTNAGIPIILELTPADRSKTKPPKPLVLQRLDLDIRQNLLETEKGQLLVYLFDMHQKEVLYLINHNRQVMIIWQRCQGPAFMVHLTNSFRNPEYRIPTEVRGISLQELLIKMAAVLKEAGSPGLRRDLTNHFLDIATYSCRVTSVSDFLQEIEVEVWP